MEFREGTQRVGLALMFTDIVGSTRKAAEMGDSEWRHVLERHDAEVRREFRHQGGVELNSAGDGFLAQFPTATAAVEAARCIRRSLARLGLQVRSGIHTTECELMGANIGGLGAHIAARVAARAGAGEILVSGTVADVLTGSGTALDERGEVDLKGVPGRWRIHAIAERGSESRAANEIGPPVS